MKTTLSHTLCAIALTAAHTASAQPEMRDAATHEQLQKKSHAAVIQDPMKKLPPANESDPAKDAPKDLISQSDILSFDGTFTLVPKRAILAIPKDLEKRSQLVNATKLVGWAEFHANNRGWITTLEVTREQAEGNSPIDEDILNSFKDSTTIVVATYHGGPISILPPKTPTAEEKTSEEPAPKP
jgi:hypothetical protein